MVQHSANLEPLKPKPTMQPTDVTINEELGNQNIESERFCSRNADQERFYACQPPEVTEEDENIYSKKRSESQDKEKDSRLDES